MEPKVSMSWFAVAVTAGLLILALGGHGMAGMWTGIGVAIAALLMATLYLADRRGARHMPDEFRDRRPADALVPRHRRDLDRRVLLQWAAILLVGGGGSRLIAALDWTPFADVGLVFTVMSIGWEVLWAGVYLSSLVDWYLILPKVSGISCPGPCERSGRQRWAGITALWCFHRGFARLLVPAVLIGCPTVIGALSDDPTGQAIAFAIAALLSVYLVDFESEGKSALHFGLNARRTVGDVVWLVRETEDWVRHEAAYLVDVAAEGAKFKYVSPDGAYAGSPFDHKHDDDGKPIGLSGLNDRKRVPDAEAPCAAGCTGVNWYCWANERAYSQSPGDG